MQRALWMWPASIRIVRRELPGIGASHNASGSLSTRNTVTLLLVAHASRMPGSGMTPPPSDRLAHPDVRNGQVQELLAVDLVAQPLIELDRRSAGIQDELPVAASLEIRLDRFQEPLPQSLALAIGRYGHLPDPGLSRRGRNHCNHRRTGRQLAVLFEKTEVKLAILAGQILLAQRKTQRPPEHFLSKPQLELVLPGPEGDLPEGHRGWRAGCFSSTKSYVFPYRSLNTATVP